jgi:thioredoxin-related protein
LNNNEVIIKGKIIGECPSEFRYTNPVDGYSYWGFRDTVQVDSLGYFKISVNPSKSSFIQLLHPISITLAIEPNKNYEIEIENNDGYRLLTINDESEIIQKYYNSLPFPAHPQFEAMKYIELPVSTTVFKLDSLLNIEKKYIDSLAFNVDISASLIEMIKKDREIYYLTKKGNIGLIKSFQEYSSNNGIVSKDIIEMWRMSMSEISLSDKYFLTSPWAFHYLENYLAYKERNEGSSDWAKELVENREKNLLHTYKINISNGLLSDEPLQFHNTAYLFEKSLQKKYELELVSLFDEFILRYPDNRYRKYIDPLINNIREFHKVAEIEFSTAIKLIEDYSSINSLNELPSIFKNRRIFVDFWSTSCGWCIDEFKHSVALKELLNTLNIDLLYISFDGDKYDKHWKDMIKYYSLEGYHIRASTALKNEIRSRFELNGIPHFALIDNTGKILIKNAQRPSKLNDLELELKNVW